MDREALAELSAGLKRAAQVTWCWLKDGDGPWNRDFTLAMVGRLSRASQEAAMLSALEDQ